MCAVPDPALHGKTGGTDHDEHDDVEQPACGPGPPGPRQAQKRHAGLLKLDAQPSEQRRRWLDPSNQLTPLLLSGEAASAAYADRSARRAAAAADFAALAVPFGPDEVIVTSRNRRGHRTHDEPDGSRWQTR